MTETSPPNDPFRADLDSTEQNDPLSTTHKTRGIGDLWQTVVEMGLGEIAMRIGSSLASLVLVLMVVWVMSNFYLKGQVAAPQSAAVAAALPYGYANH